MSAREKAAAANKARRDKAAIDKAAKKQVGAKPKQEAEAAPNQALLRRPSAMKSKTSMKDKRDRSGSEGGSDSEKSDSARGRTKERVRGSGLPSQGQRVVVKRRGKSAGAVGSKERGSRGGSGSPSKRGDTSSADVVAFLKESEKVGDALSSETELLQKVKEYLEQQVQKLEEKITAGLSNVQLSAVAVANHPILPT